MLCPGSIIISGNVIVINPFMPTGLLYLKSLGRSISYIRGVWLDIIITMFFFLEISELITNL